jgi:dihydrofolate reductase
MNASLDGYTADVNGNFDWTVPDEEIHSFFNDFERPHGIHLYGRRMYETMAIWEDDDFLEGEPEVMHEYAKIWRAAEKIVYSRTLKEASTPRTRIERDFNPEEIRRLKAEATTDISIAGPELAAEALKAGLVDEYHAILAPVIVGGGTPILPSGIRFDLELLNEHRFANGTVHLHYRVK